MSRTKLSRETILKVWVRAGGRCQYRGCNQALWRDDLTLRRMNRSYLAHIVADQVNGPRGALGLSEELRDKPENIILLCDAHHRLIDKEDVAGHPVELLQKYKRDHEERVERQTAVHSSMRTHVVMFSTRIGYHKGCISYDQAREAVFPERYPASEAGIKLDLGDTEMSEKDPEFWHFTAQYLERSLRTRLEYGVSESGLPLSHLSIFALAPIPTLIHFGKLIGDIVSADVYQRHRATNSWRWSDSGEVESSYALSRPVGKLHSGRVAVNLSLSGTIHESEIERLLPGVQIYKMSIAKPRLDFLRRKEQLELFCNEWSGLLGEIRRAHGEGCEVHLFPAVPCAIAVEIGRSIIPKSSPLIHVYDHDKELEGFHFALTV